MPQEVPVEFDQRRMTELAIEAMRRSGPEQRPDGSVETAARGELRDGIHAEFILAGGSGSLAEEKGGANDFQNSGAPMKVDRAVARPAMARQAAPRRLAPGIGPSVGPWWPDEVAMSARTGRWMRKSTWARGRSTLCQWTQFRPLAVSSAPFRYFRSPASRICPGAYRICRRSGLERAHSK